MRVTDASTYDNMRRTIAGAKEKLTKAQNQAGTGRRVQKPSDDPTAAAAARRETSRKALAESGMKVTEQAQSSLQGTEDALSGIQDALASARELAVSGSSGTVGEEIRRNAAYEVRKIREQMVALGNTNVAGKYVFAGYRDQEPAFDASGKFVGENSTKELQAMPGLRVAASISGQSAFGIGEDDDVFKTLDSLASALESNDVDGIRNSLGSIDKNENRLLRSRAEVGAMMEHATIANSVADRHAYRSTLELSSLLEADEIGAATDLVQSKTALEKAVAVASQMQVSGLVGK